MKQVILYKTHVWSDSIELDVIKLMHETSNDFRVILHDETGDLIALIKSEKVKSITLCVTEAVIKSIYCEGWVDMFLSNHWILMWFFKQHSYYDYYWSIEYDVKVVGNSNKIWSIESDSDFLYPIGNRKVRITNKYTKTAKKLDMPLYAGFLQIARYSQKALEYLDSQYVQGVNAQDEIATFTILNKSGFKMDNKPLHRMIKGTWSYDNFYQEENLKQYYILKYHTTKDETYILHPIKPRDDD